MKDLKGNIINSSTDLSLYILDTTGVVTVAGDSFGAPGHIRFSYATSNKIITQAVELVNNTCLLYTSPSPRDRTRSRMPSSA